MEEPGVVRREALDGLDGLGRDGIDWRHFGSLPPDVLAVALVQPCGDVSVSLSPRTPPHLVAAVTRHAAQTARAAPERLHLCRAPACAFLVGLDCCALGRAAGQMI